MLRLVIIASIGAFAGVGCIDNGCHNDGTGGASAGTAGETIGTATQTLDACSLAECPLGGNPSEVKAACDDGDPATVDRCAAVTPECGAVCVHFEGPCDYLDGAEVQQARCDDGDPCTADRCAWPGECAHLRADGCGLPCDPAKVEATVGGKQCDDGYPKTVDRCVAVPPDGAVCAHVAADCDWLDYPAEQAKACDDGDPCTLDSCAFPTHCAHSAAPGCSP